MAELKDDITEERRILKEAGILDEKLLEKMDIYPGDRVRFRFYYPHSGFEEMIGHFLGFYTLYEGCEAGLRKVRGRRRFAISSFSRADARASGCPTVFAPL